MTRFPRFHRTGRLATQRIVMAIVTVSAAGALARPAAAQVYWGDSDRYHGDRYRNNNYNDYNYRLRQYQQHDFFFPFSGFMRPPPVVDSTGAAAAKIGNAADYDDRRHRRFDGRLVGLWA